MNVAVGPAEWYGAFRREVRQFRWADSLRESALKGHLREWTAHLTGARAPGRSAAGAQQEYLAIDVMAFPRANRPGWRRPGAAFELENRTDLEAISYSVWKVSVVQCRFGGVFCYCRQPEEIKDLLVGLSKAEDFPDRFFRPYIWNGNLGQFRLLL